MFYRIGSNRMGPRHECLLRVSSPRKHCEKFNRTLLLIATTKLSPISTLLVGVAPARPAEVLPLRRVLVYSRRRAVLLLLRLLFLFHQILHIARQATVAGHPAGTFLAVPARAVRGDATFLDGGLPARAAEARVAYVVVVDVRVLELVPVAQLDIARRPAEADVAIGRAGVVRSLGTVLPVVAVVRRVP